MLSPQFYCMLFCCVERQKVDFKALRFFPALAFYCDIARLGI